MPQLRKDPVTREWVIIASERSRRPTDFKPSEDLANKPAFSPNCPFCPGNELMTPPEILAYRSEGTGPNTPGWWVRVVPNKFPALGVEGELDRTGYGMYDLMNGIGAHEVIIECAEHDLSIGTLPPQHAQDVIWAYRERHLDLVRDRRFKYILLFRNHGKVAGASLEHPHCQLMALPMVPSNVQAQIEGAARYYEYHERCIYCDMLKQEIAFGERIVCMNDGFVAVCPYAAKYPFEVRILPRRHSASLADEDRPTVNQFTEVLQECLRRIASCLNNPPYNFTLHTAPINQDRERDFHWHMAIMPRLTIAAGFEMGTGIFINVTGPEEAAKHLRAASPDSAAVEKAEAGVH